MADLIDFNEFVRKKRGLTLAKWSENIGPRFDGTTRIKDLPDEILLVLAEGGNDGNALLDHMIMNAWGVSARDARELDPSVRMMLLDLSLFLIDQFRFECMMRLGWTEPLPTREVPIAELVGGDQGSWKNLRKTPELKSDHTHYHRFRKMLKMEKETFLRRQIPAVLEQFRQRVRTRQ
jgi:hypothetical protein